MCACGQRGAGATFLLRVRFNTSKASVAGVPSETKQGGGGSWGVSAGPGHDRPS